MMKIGAFISKLFGKTRQIERELELETMLDYIESLEDALDDPRLPETTRKDYESAHRTATTRLFAMQPALRSPAAIAA